MADESLNTEKVTSFPLHAGNIEIGEELSTTFARIPLWDESVAEDESAEQITVVPGVRIIDACGRWIGKALGRGTFMKGFTMEFPVYLAVNEPMKAVSTLRKVS